MCTTDGLRWTLSVTSFLFLSGGIPNTFNFWCCKSLTFHMILRFFSPLSPTLIFSTISCTKANQWKLARHRKFIESETVPSCGPSSSVPVSPPLNWNWLIRKAWADLKTASKNWKPPLLPSLIHLMHDGKAAPSFTHPISVFRKIKGVSGH